MLRFLLPIGIASFLGTESACAFTTQNAIDAVGASLPSGGGSTIGGLLANIAGSFVPIAAVAAALGMTISGFFLALSGNETQATTARRVFISSLAGLALIRIAPFFASYLIGPGFGPTGGSSVLSAPAVAGSGVAGEALGLVTYLEFPLGILCVIMIVVSGLRAIVNFGSEDGVAQLRRTVLFVIAGFILVGARATLGLGIATTGSTAPIIGVVLTVVNRIIFYMGVLALAMVIFAGFLMILNIGKEDQYSKAKGLLIRVAIGLLIWAAAGGIVFFFMSLVP